jgi:putative restriction endonuclease
MSSEELLLRESLFAKVFDFADEFGGSLTRGQLGAVDFGDKQVRVIDIQGGIWNPGAAWPLETPLQATLSINTTLSDKYEDAEVDSGLWRYDYQSGGSAGKNTKLRKAMELQLPLLWFVQQEDSRYVPYKVWIIEDFPDRGYCHIAPDLSLAEILNDTTKVHTAIEKKYALREVKQRLHQPAFRANVISAYKTRCSICKLNHGKLLEAAHIIPDSEEDSTTTVDNGISLCKIHHAAYDNLFIGISPDYQVHVRPDLLVEIDGPMLKHGIQEMNKVELFLPMKDNKKPNREYLDLRFKKFKQKAAG